MKCGDLKWQRGSDGGRTQMPAITSKIIATVERTRLLHNSRNDFLNIKILRLGYFLLCTFRVGLAKQFFIKIISLITVLLYKLSVSTFQKSKISKRGRGHDLK